MYKITKIVTNNGQEFESVQQAIKSLEKDYGDKLTSVCHKLIGIEKYIDVCEFVNSNLCLFGELLELSREIKEGCREEEED